MKRWILAGVGCSILWIACSNQVIVVPPGSTGKLSINNPKRQEARSEPVATGVVVEKISTGSILGRSGVEAGDILLSWSRETVTGERVGGLLESPFDWHQARLEQAPRGVIEIVGQRRQDTKVFRVAGGNWRSADIRPRWQGESRAQYLRGLERLRNGEHRQGVEIWRHLADQLDSEGWHRESLWLAFEIAVFLVMNESDSVDSDAFETVLATIEQPRDLGAAHCLQELGALFHQFGRFETAQEYYSLALEIRRELLGESLSEADSLNDLGSLAWDRGNLDLAEKYHREALRIRGSMAPESVEMADSLSNLGLAFHDQGQFDSAEEAYLEAFDLRRARDGDPLELAVSWTNLGALAFDQGDLSTAKEYFSQALAIEEELMPGSTTVAVSLLNLGAIAKDLGQLREAEELFRRALAIHSSVAPESPDVAFTLRHLAQTARDRGFWAEAEALHRQALEIYQAAEVGGLDLARVLISLANLFADRGDLTRAAELYEESLGIHQEVAPQSSAVALSLGNLGTVRARQGETEVAEQLLRKALEIEKTISPDSLRTAWCWNNLGEIHKRRGDLTAAFEAHSTALRIHRMKAPGSLAEARSLGNLGGTAAQREAWRESEAYYLAALEIQSELAPESMATAESLRAISNLNRERNNLKKAFRYSLDALAVLESQISELGGSYAARRNIRAEKRGYYLDTLEMAFLQGDLDSTFEILERFRARTFLSMLAEREILFEEFIPQDLREQRRDLSARYHRALERLASLSLRTDQARVAEIRNELAAIGRQKSQIEERVRRTSPRLAELQYPKHLSLDEARRALDPGTLVVLPIVVETSTFLLMFSRDLPIRGIHLPYGESSWRQKIDQLQQLLREGGLELSIGERRESAIESLLVDLYDILFLPIEREIERSQRLLVLPDGPLHSLPFGALKRRDQSGQSRFLTEWGPSLHVALSSTVYAEIKKRRPQESKNEAPNPVKMAIFGDPSYPEFSPAMRTDQHVDSSLDDPELRALARRGGLGFSWHPLPHTLHEANGIAAAFSGGHAQIFLGSEALEENVKNLDPTVRILHIATHAYADDHLPLSSFVALTIPEELSGDRDNGLLQAWEVLEQVRVDLDLLVLSGCSTALGQEVRGEGFIGLTRAFQYAGARSVIASLWNVADRSTAELMIRFYKYLQAGLTKDEALRAAQMDLIRGPIEVEDEQGNKEFVDYSSPYHWAAFQLYGDWQ